MDPFAVGAIAMFEVTAPSNGFKVGTSGLGANNVPFMAMEFLDGQALQEVITVRVENTDTAPLGLSVSASGQGQEFVLTFVNPKHDTGLNVSCALEGVKAAGDTARILHHEDMNACNTFEQPNRIVPKDHRAEAEGAGVRLELPPLSLATVLVRI